MKRRERKERLAGRTRQVNELKRTVAALESAARKKDKEIRKWQARAKNEKEVVESDSSEDERIRAGYSDEQKMAMLDTHSYDTVFDPEVSDTEEEED